MSEDNSVESLSSFLEELHANTRSNMQLTNMYRHVEKFTTNQDRRLVEYKVCVEGVLQALAEDSNESAESKLQTIADILLKCHTDNVADIFKAPAEAQLVSMED